VHCSTDSIGLQASASAKACSRAVSKVAQRLAVPPEPPEPGLVVVELVVPEPAAPAAPPELVPSTTALPPQPPAATAKTIQKRALRMTAQI